VGACGIVKVGLKQPKPRACVRGAVIRTHDRLTQWFTASCTTASCCRATTSRVSCEALEKFEIAIPAKMLMIATTNNISTRVNARLLEFSFIVVESNRSWSLKMPGFRGIPEN
jgi:hypothetical protein